MMGCCCSSDNPEKNALLNDDNNYDSVNSNAKRKSTFIEKPKCKCGALMNLYELQCCYLEFKSNKNGLYDGTIDCSQCMLQMTESTTLLWNCMNKHDDDYKYDLCLDCAETLYQKQKNDESKEEKKQDKYNVFDKKYNIPNEINWNYLYEVTHDDGRILTVMQTINKYTSKYKNYKQILPPKLLNFIDECKEKEKLVKKCHHRLHTHDGWTQVVDDVDNISIWYKKEENSAINSLKTKMLMKCTPLDIICVLNEFDLLTELISLIPIDTVLLHEPSVTAKTIYIKGHLWFPLKNRDAVAKTAAFDLLDQYGEILIYGHSIDPNEEEDVKEFNLEGRNDILKCDSKTVRMEANLSEGVLIPRKIKDIHGENLTEVISVLNVDPKSFVPATLLNWANRTLGFYAAKMIRHRCEDLRGTKHAKRIATKPIYRKWRRDMKEYIAKVRLLEKQEKEKNNDPDGTKYNIQDLLNKANLQNN